MEEVGVGKGFKVYHGRDYICGLEVKGIHLNPLHVDLFVEYDCGRSNRFSLDCDTMRERKLSIDGEGKLELRLVSVLSGRRGNRANLRVNLPKGYELEDN